MENSISRIIIETTVRQTIQRLKEDPKRSIRNLVDMALQFSSGRFQNQFFETAHTMLEDESSAYYDFVYDATNHIETEHLVNFGMNLGYNSCTWGAKHIRENEKALGFNIPWVIFFHMEQPEWLNHFEQYHQAISEGEALGIFSWVLYTRTDPVELLPLVQKHPNSAFFLFCDSEYITPAFLEEVSPIKQLMLVIRYNNDADEACAMLREAELPYSVFCYYSSQDAKAVVSGDLFGETQHLHPIFTVLIPQTGCPDEVRRSVYQAVVKARNAQRFQTLPWEIYEDTRRLDEIISDDACCMFFDPRGDLYKADTPSFNRKNLFEYGLTAIMKQANPKPDMLSSNKTT